MSKESSGFVREERYFVLKNKDIADFLGREEQLCLSNIAGKLTLARLAEGRGVLSTVVVEDDWPETPVIWSMIEARMTGGVDFVQWQAARLQEVEQEVAVLRKEVARLSSGNGYSGSADR